MARPRTPAAVLKLNGAFKTNPARARVDPEGSGPFCGLPPTHLPQDALVAWRYLVERLPKIAFYSCDEAAVEMAARQLALCWADPTCNPKALGELRQWLAKLGMFPVDRAKLATKAPDAEKDPYLD